MIVDLFLFLCYDKQRFLNDLGGLKVSNNIENNDDYIVIRKETIVNYFFSSLLIIAFIVFMILMVKSVVAMKNSNENELNSDLISYYFDDYLNITWGVDIQDTPLLCSVIQNSDYFWNWLKVDKEVYLMFLD